MTRAFADQLPKNQPKLGGLEHAPAAATMMMVTMRALTSLLFTGPAFRAEIFVAGTMQAMAAKTVEPAPASFSVSHLVSFQPI
jgi:hypothetical protein